MVGLGYLLFLLKKNNNGQNCQLSWFLAQNKKKEISLFLADKQTKTSQW